MTSWFTSWYDTAKQKLAETNEFMRHDIQEFTQAVQTDASKLVAATATTMKEKLNINVDLEEASAATRVVKDSLSNFLGNIASKVGPQRPDGEENETEIAYVGTSAGTKVMSPAEARIFAIRTDPATFCNEPDNESEFHMWLPTFNMEEKKNEISSLMLDVSQIRAIYTKLVPSAVSHCDFWMRYFFKIHQHEKAEERRALLVERAHKTHDDIGWEDEDDDWVQAENFVEGSNHELNNADPDNGVASPTSTKESTQVEEENAQENEVDIPVTENNEIKRETEQEQELVTVISAPTANVEKQEKEAEQLLDKNVIEEIASASVENQLVSNQSAPDYQEKVVDAELAETVLSNEQSENVETNRKTEESESPKENIKPGETVTGTTAMKTPSSEESSDDWEKDFDLDMTEDEIQQALKESEQLDDMEIAEDWEDWE